MRGLLALLLSPTLSFAQVNFRSGVVPVLPGLPSAAASMPSLAPLPGSLSPMGALPSLEAPGSIEAPSALSPLHAADEGSPSDAPKLPGVSAEGLGAVPSGSAFNADSPDSSIENGLGLNAVFFDKAGHHSDSPEPAVGASDGESLVKAPAATKGLSRFYPRVVFIMDVFKGKVPDATVKLIDTFQQKGVQVVFISERPARGKGSVDEILTSRLKGRRENALIVAAEGGGKIYSHTSQAENPKSLIEDHPAFSSKDAAIAFPRVLKALEAANHSNLLERAEEVLVLGDSKKNQSLVKLFPKGAYIHGVKDDQSLSSAMKAVLGVESMETVSIERNKIRSYLEHLSKQAPKESYGGGGGWSGGDRQLAKGDLARQLAFYKGVIMYDLMGRLYRDIRNGQYHLATPDRAEARLKSMWKHPQKNFVRVPAELARVMQTDAWRRYQGGTLMSAVGWLRNYYARKFPDYPNGILEGVVQTIANLASDGKSLISVPFQSPYTGRRYLVHVRPARVEMHRGMHGPELIASSYRTGKEKPGEQDDVESKLLALAVLRGYATSDNGKWLVNGQEVSKIRVDFEYNTRTLSKSYQVSDLGKLEGEVASLIERMEADTAFTKAYDKKKEEEAKARKLAKAKADKRKGA